MSEITKNTKVAEVVRTNYQAATIFKNYKIDFCCNGGRTLQQACETKKLDLKSLIKELKELSDETSIYDQMDDDLLVDLIVKKHHRYVRKTIPDLLYYLKKIAAVHGKTNPELVEIEESFKSMAVNLLDHMEFEESKLFPSILGELEIEGLDNGALVQAKNEHEVEGRRTEYLARLTNDFTPPESACTTYRVAFSLLKEFIDDLYFHIHLENNILFNKN